VVTKPKLFPFAERRSAGALLQPFVDHNPYFTLTPPLSLFLQQKPTC